MARARSGALYPAVFLTSASVLMLQVALTRLFSFTLWYHFAYVVISLALLGYGASGALLSAFPGILRGNLGRTLFGCALGAAIVIPASLAVYAHTPFYPLQLFAQPLQWWYLALYYAAAGIPFFLAGVCISGAITAASERVTRVYCADLVGAGLGAGLVVPLIWRFETPGVVILAAGLMAAAAACWAWWWRPAASVAPIALIIALTAGGGPWWRSLEFRPSAEKMMAIVQSPEASERILRQGGAPSTSKAVPKSPTASSKTLCRLLPRYTRWGAVFRVDVLEPTDEAARARSYYRFGAGAHSGAPVPFWVTIPHDGDANAMIFGARDPRRLAFLKNHGLTLPYVLVKRGAKVLVLGAGGGTDVLAGLFSRAKQVTALELDPLTARLVTNDFADYAGRLSEQPGVRFIVGEGRSFVRGYPGHYDLIQINSTDTLTAMSIGAGVLNENYLYTREAFNEYLDQLGPNGVLSVMHQAGAVRPNQTRFSSDILRLGSLREALLRRGARRPEDHIAVIWANGLMTLLTRARPFLPSEVALLERHCVENGFELVHLPYRDLDNDLSRFLRASPEARAEYLRRSPFECYAPTDDAPFVWPHLKWQYVLHHARRISSRSVATGQMVLLPLLAVAVAGAGVLILGPLGLFRRRGVYSQAAWGLGLYFAALGFAFMFIEISFIQKFVLFLGYPTYSLTVVVSALLVSSGIGSLASRRLISRAERSLVWALAGVVGLGALYLLLGSSVFDAFLGYELWVRIVVAVAMIAPLGFVMGMFFPTGIRVVNEVAPAFVPWAWGINACTSVVAAILAVMLAMSVGFRMVGICALAIYIIGVIGLYAAHRGGLLDASQPR